MVDSPSLFSFSFSFFFGWIVLVMILVSPFFDFCFIYSILSLSLLHTHVYLHCAAPGVCKVQHKGSFQVGAAVSRHGPRGHLHGLSSI